MNFEKKMSRLEEIVQKMEKGELTLEESLKLFEEGVSLTKQCNESLQSAEQKVKVLLGVNEKGEPMTEEFVSES